MHKLYKLVGNLKGFRLFTKPVFEAIQTQLATSVRVTTPVARATFGVPMTDYRWLTPDRLVQQSAFANGHRFEGIRE